MDIGMMTSVSKRSQKFNLLDHKQKFEEVKTGGSHLLEYWYLLISQLFIEISFFVLKRSPIIEINELSQWVKHI